MFATWQCVTTGWALHPASTCHSSPHLVAGKVSFAMDCGSQNAGAVPRLSLTAGRCAGYRWVLQKEGEPPLQRQGSRSAWAGGTAGEVEQLRAELRQRGDQLEGLRAEIMGLEATRNE